MCTKNKRYDPVVRCYRSTTALVANGNSRRRVTTDNLHRNGKNRNKLTNEKAGGAF